MAASQRKKTNNIEPNNFHILNNNKNIIKK